MGTGLPANNWGVGFRYPRCDPVSAPAYCRLALLRVLRLASFLLPVRLVFDFIVGQRASGSSRPDHPAVKAPLRRRANNANAVLIESLAQTIRDFAVNRANAGNLANR